MNKYSEYNNYNELKKTKILIKFVNKNQLFPNHKQGFAQVETISNMYIKSESHNKSCSNI